MGCGTAEEKRAAVAAAAQKAGFSDVHTEALPEIDGMAHQMRHEVSGARLLFLQNEDVDKSFSITFKTPAADDTGVFHILEHSVLCGSAKFPVKEPFVNLLKGSMQTFLNAMTFPDKTMYPVASTNMADLMNLTDVYMDAVFHPRIYQTEDIFKQEGWHLEALRADALGDAPEGEADALRAEDAGIPAPDEPAEVRLQYNGVVYNEMKGALSEPDSVLYDALSAALFPDTTYRFESGGTPAAIPDLTYAAFLDSHERHYRADNAYIILYGDMDIERMLTFLDAEYLSHLPQDAKAAAPNPLDLQAPVVCTDASCTMSTVPDNACMALGYVVGTSCEVERAVATDILVDAIAGSNEAPLKKAVMDAKIGDDFHAYLADSVYQPFVVMQLKGMKPKAEETFGDVVRTEIEHLASGGLDRELLRAAVSHAEFVMREHNFGMSDGVVYSMAAMNGWLYDDADALSYIRYEELFARLKERIESGWFEELLRELFLESDHWAQARVIPTEAEAGAAQDAKLARMREALTPGELEQIEADAAALVRAQMTPDAPEALTTLPMLAVSDLGDAPAEPDFRVCERDGMTVIRHEVETHGIAYATRYYSLDCLEYEELPYAAILGMVLGRLDTDGHTASELDTLIQGKLGNLSFAPDVYEPLGEAATYATFVVSSSALADEAAQAAGIADEVLGTTRFTDIGKISDMLTQRKVALEQTFCMAGHSAAANRALSYVSRTAKAKEQLSGIDFYLFLRELIEDLDARAEALMDKLASLAERIFADDNCVLSFAGSDEAFDAYWHARKGLGIRAASEPARLVVPEPHDAHEAFGVSADVTFTAMAADRKRLQMPFAGAWLLASKMLTYGYLWNEVRVVGGAYGVGFSSRRGGQTFFHSYRDPKIDPTIEAFRGAPAWLRSASVPAEEFEGYIVSTVASMDAPQKPRDLVRRQDTMHFTGCTHDDRAQTRRELVGATLDEVRALADQLQELMEDGHVCCVGDAKLIEGCKEGFTLLNLT